MYNIPKWKKHPATSVILQELQNDHHKTSYGFVILEPRTSPPPLPLLVQDFLPTSSWHVWQADFYNSDPTCYHHTVEQEHKYTASSLELHFWLKIPLFHSSGTSSRHCKYVRPNLICSLCKSLAHCIQFGDSNWTDSSAQVKLVEPH